MQDFNDFHELNLETLTWKNVLKNSYLKIKLLDKIQW